MQLKHPYQYNTLGIFVNFLLSSLNFPISFISLTSFLFNVFRTLLLLSGDGSKEPQMPSILCWLPIYTFSLAYIPCFKVICPLLLDVFTELLNEHFKQHEVQSQTCLPPQALPTPLKSLIPLLVYNLHSCSNTNSRSHSWFFSSLIPRANSCCLYYRR